MTKQLSIKSVPEALALFRDKGAYCFWNAERRTIVSWIDTGQHRVAYVVNSIVNSLDTGKHLKRIPINEHFKRMGWPGAPGLRTVVVYAEPGEVDRIDAEQKAASLAYDAERKAKQLARRRRITCALCDCLGVAYDDSLVEKIADVMSEVAVEGF
jgi:hypothetical protein